MHDEHRLALINADRRRLVRAAARLLGPAEAEDAVQDAYVRALEADMPALDAAQAWLLTVVRNLSIDRLRRRHWMQQWLAEMNADDTVSASPSAEMEAVLAQQAARAMRLLTACLTPADGAAVLLYEVFGFGHAEIARISGRSEAASRQQLRRALLRLRQADGATESRPPSEAGPQQDAVLRLYLQSLQMREPQALWAMLRQSPVSALTRVTTVAGAAATAPHAIASGVVQVGGQLGLVMSLDGVRICVLPLGAQARRDTEFA